MTLVPLAEVQLFQGKNVLTSIGINIAFVPSVKLSAKMKTKQKTITHAAFPVLFIMSGKFVSVCAAQTWEASEYRKRQTVAKLAFLKREEWVINCAPTNPAVNTGT